MSNLNNAASSSIVDATSTVDATLSSYNFYYEVDLIRKARNKSVVATTAEGGVIKEGSKGCWMEMLPVSVFFNTDLAATKDETIVAAGWVEKCFDSIMSNTFKMTHDMDINVLRMVLSELGKYDVVAPHLMDLPDDATILDVQVRLDLVSIFKDGVKVVVDEDTFDVEERDFHSIRIYFNDMNLGGVNTNPNSLINKQVVYLNDYRVEVQTGSVSSGRKMNIFSAAVVADGASTKPLTAKVGGQSKASILEGLKNAGLKRAGGISSVGSIGSTVITPGTAIANAVKNIKPLN